MIILILKRASDPPRPICPAMIERPLIHTVSYPCFLISFIVVVAIIVLIITIFIYCLLFLLYNVFHHGDHDERPTPNVEKKLPRPVKHNPWQLETIKTAGQNCHRAQSKSPFL